MSGFKSTEGAGKKLIHVNFITKKLSSRRSLGSVLKAARRRLGFSLEEAEIRTKIPLKHLRALEEGQFMQLPAEAYNIGFVRGYAEILRLNPTKIIQMYREERSKTWHYDNKEDVSLVPKKMGDWQFLITPKLLGIVGMIILFGGVVTYIVSQIHQFTKPPALTIASVPEEFTTSKDQVTVGGQTSAGATISINSEGIFVNPEGSFSQVVQLSPGVNEIVVLAKNRADKTTRRTVKVLYNQDIAKADLPATTNQ